MKKFLSIIYWIFIAILGLFFVPNILNWVTDFNSSFHPLISIALLVVEWIIGVLIVTYLAMIPAPFIAKADYRDVDLSV